MRFFNRRPSHRAPVSGSGPNPLDIDVEAWRIVEASNKESGELVIFRIRLTKPDRADIERLTTAVVIQWPHRGRVIPPDDVNQQQLAFEEALDPLSSDGESELVQVVTEL